MALIICSECGKEYSNKAKACPNCGAPTETQVNNTFAILPDEYYTKYSKSIASLSSEDFNTVLNAIKDIYKEVDNKTVIKNPVNINNYEEFFNFTKALVYCITMFADAKGDDTIIPVYNLVLFFVKYNTRLILIYGDNIDRTYLTRCIYLLQGLKELNNTITCNSCNKEVPKGLEYCPYCGKPMYINNIVTNNINTKYNTKAIWAFIVSLLSIFFHILAFISLALSIKSIDELDKSDEKGTGLAITGLIISIIFVILMFINYLNGYLTMLD